ncbi:MAG TPA: hypothetical protein VFW95_05150 [Candidatus Limnocylindria bacterium]|nr:hypothetical protein [Candidatus Limnocylindria bacterium]
MTDQPPNRSAADLEARIAALERKSWRSTVDESRSGMETAFWALMHALFPEEARKHLKVAGREQLLAARVYLDRWIERLDEADSKGAGDQPHEKIEIE